MKSFRDAATGVLKSWGFADSNAPGDLARVEPDDFALEPGEWQLVADAWVAYTQPFADLKEAELANFRALREMFLNRVSGIGFAAMQAGDTAVIDASIAVRQGLLDLPESPLVAAATDLPSLRLAIKQQYAAVVGNVPDSAKAAFAKVDA